MASSVLKAFFFSSAALLGVIEGLLSITIGSELLRNNSQFYGNFREIYLCKWTVGEEVDRNKKVILRSYFHIYLADFDR